MSLRAKLAAFDDAALEGLASKGVVRRARRDLEANRATIVEHGRAAATIDADGQRVSIDERGPAAARCGCPASGICRHIVLAVMALHRDGGTADDSVQLGGSTLDDPASGDAAPALGDPALGDSALGPPPLDASAAGESGEPKVAGSAAGRRRLGQPAAAGARLDPRRFIAAARAAIEREVSAVLPGRSATAADAFLDLATSSRAGSLPRLAAELRWLSRHAALAAARDAAFDAEAFLIDAARAFALTQALDADPCDPQLTGRIRREYLAADPLDLWMLGAARWRSAAGARGLTAYGFSPGTRRWHGAHQGRAAGTDPRFDPATAYHAPLWGAGVLQTLIGRTLHLDAPSVADDGSIAPTLPGPARAGPSIPPWPDLIDAGAAADDFAALRRDLATRAGIGLRRSAVPLPALIVPASFGRIAFRDLDQAYEWEVADRHGAILTLELHADDGKIAERLPALARRIRAILVEAALVARGLSVVPVTLFIDDKPALRVVNLGFDELPRPDVVGKTFERVRGVLSAHGDAQTGVAAHAGANPADPLESVVSAALDAAVAVVERSARSDLERIVGACEGRGLMTLASAVRRLLAADDVVSALWTAYIASEARAAIRING